jgi:hypothetical protein
MSQQEIAQVLTEVVSGLDQANVDLKAAAKLVRPAHPEQARLCDHAAERARNLRDRALSIQQDITCP